MSDPRLLRYAELRPTPWKNGGGATREIAVFPPDAGMDDFQWRLSVATVESAGPFSAFPGVDRVLTVIDGRLDLYGDGLSVALDAGSAPFAFDGAMPVTGRPVGGVAHDLNVMVRRGTWRAEVTRLTAGERIRRDGIQFLFALGPQSLGGMALARWDCVAVDAALIVGGDALHVRLTADP